MEPPQSSGEPLQPAFQNITAAIERDRARAEFFATYNVMTGVRIAVTLGGFFLFMVITIFYKSRRKSVKALKDPKIVELAEAVVAEEVAVEEELQLTAAIEDALAERARVRHSLGELPPWPHSSRFSSIGSCSGQSFRRFKNMRGDSLPTSSLRFELPCYVDDIQRRRRSQDRRFSSVTCSSSGSSYLERRGSSVMCGLIERRLSPCPSEHEDDRIAPLASVGSFGISVNLEEESESIGLDSVFVSMGGASTDDEVEPFSTDSGGGEGEKKEDTEMKYYKQVPTISLDGASTSRETLF